MSLIISGIYNDELKQKNVIIIKLNDKYSVEET